jgi:glyoxylase-like metal-dependent hydrolase (beta-lactamase superfamily II)
MKIHVLDHHFLDNSEAIASFLLEGPEGYVLVEAGPASTLAHLEAALSNIGVKAADIQHVLLSHIHFDHAGAAWYFAQAGAKIYVHPKGLPHLAAPERLYNSARMIYGEQMDALWGPMHPIDEALLYAPEHGETLQLCGLECKAWYTPGHAVHHIAWQVSAPDENTETPKHENNSVLFTGDVAGVKIHGGPAMPPCPPPDINIEDWMASIELMRSLPVEAFYLTHYGRISERAAHLDALSHHLSEWAAWMRPYAANQTPAAEIVPLFEAFVAGQLQAGGADAATMKRYEAANPAFMSVNGLLRYWIKSGKL